MDPMSGTTLLRVVTTDPTPPYEQLRRQLTELISSGVLAPGDRLPPLRQLAADLGLAVGTVARSYRELEAAGPGPLPPRRRHSGAGTGWRQGAGEVAETVRGHAEAFVRQARLLGATDDDVRSPSPRRS